MRGGLGWLRRLGRVANRLGVGLVVLGDSEEFEGVVQLGETLTGGWVGTPGRVRVGRAGQPAVGRENLGGAGVVGQPEQV